MNMNMNMDEADIDGIEAKVETIKQVDLDTGYQNLEHINTLEDNNKTDIKPPLLINTGTEDWNDLTKEIKV